MSTRMADGATQPPDLDPSTVGSSAADVSSDSSPAKVESFWSAPSAPQPKSDASSPSYLPPVSPPGKLAVKAVGGPDTAPPVVAPSRRSSKWGWRALVSFLAGAIVMGGGYTTSNILAGRNPRVTRVAEVESSVGEATTELTDAAGGNVASGVAKVLGPAVVQVETNVGLGSGVIYGDGLIITNAHVLAGSDQVRVRLSDGRTLPAEILGAADTVDVAVVSVGEGLDLPIAQLATNETVVVGQEAVAIGSPFELQQTVTQGIVSAVARPVQDPSTGTITAMIQTDASINPGNSGGALADAQGRVVGINTAIQTDGSAGSVGVGFAIPIDTVINAADRLVAGETLESGLLGITGGQTTDGSAGVQVIEVTPGSGAEQAGVQVGDRILSFDDAPVTRSDELAGLVVAHPPGDEVILEVVRGTENLEIRVTLGAK